MAKEVVKKIKLQIAAGKATPAPPVGTVLGPAGINLGEFCTKYNEATRDKMKEIDPIMAKHMVRECVYRGFCPELKCCGFVNTPKFQEELSNYRTKIQ